MNASIQSRQDLRRLARGQPLAASRGRGSAGLSLLEVMLSIAILGLAIATMGELVHVGTRAAAETRDLTKAQILCEGKMAELAAAVIPLEAAGPAPFDLDPDWTYTVLVSPLSQEGLLVAQVTVEQVVEQGRPVSFTLTRWLVDPLLEQTQDTDTLTNAESASTGAATTTSGQSTTTP